MLNLDLSIGISNNSDFGKNLREFQPSFQLTISEDQNRILRAGVGLSNMDPLNMNGILEDFSDRLIPSDDFLQSGKRTTDEIIRILKTPGPFEIDRFHISGSIGTKTGISCDPHLSLVVFINNQLPPFGNVIGYFKNKLFPGHSLLYGKYIHNGQVKLDYIRANQFSLQFRVNGFTFEVVPAPNLVKGYFFPDCATRAIFQANEVREYVKKNPAVGQEYGTAVREQYLEFVKVQTPYIHKLIRLCRFWNNTLHFGTTVTERTILIELVAIRVGRIMEGSGINCIFTGFKEFLELMRFFDRINIVFSLFYDNSAIPVEVKFERPLVLDPINPCNNFAAFRGTEKKWIINKFKEFSQQTLSRIANGAALQTLFVVQPNVVNFGHSPCKWLLGFSKGDLITPVFIVRMSKEEFLIKNFNFRKVIRFMYTSLTAIELGLLSSGIPFTFSEVELAKINIQDLVNNNLGGLANTNVPTNWMNGFKNHEAFHFTFAFNFLGSINVNVLLSGSF